VRRSQRFVLNHFASSSRGRGCLSQRAHLNTSLLIVYISYPSSQYGHWARPDAMALA
jgi:hypothetical protein